MKFRELIDRVDDQSLREQMHEAFDHVEMDTDQAYEDGRDDGYEDGYQDGSDHGYSRGYEVGFHEAGGLA